MGEEVFSGQQLTDLAGEDPVGPRTAKSQGEAWDPIRRPQHDELRRLGMDALQRCPKREPAE